MRYAELVIKAAIVLVLAVVVCGLTYCCSERQSPAEQRIKIHEDGPEMQRIMKEALR